jgi:PIN domain of ribonuclease
VIQFAKKTGDYSALSHPDLCVLALTYALDKAERERNTQSRADEVCRYLPPFLMGPLPMTTSLVRLLALQPPT